MQKLMEVIEVHKIDKHGVILLGQNKDLDFLSEAELETYIGDVITLCLTSGDAFDLKVIGVDRLYPCFSPKNPQTIAICVGHAIDSDCVEKGSIVFVCDTTKNEFSNNKSNIDEGYENNTEHIPYIDVSQFDVKKVKVFFICNDNMPRTKQIARLKSVFEKMQSLQNSELLTRIKADNELELGVFLIDEAERIIHKGERVGLRFRIIEIENGNG